MGTPTASTGSVRPALKVVFGKQLFQQQKERKRAPQEKVPNCSGKGQECGRREKAESRSTTKKRSRGEREDVEEMSNGKAAFQDLCFKLAFRLVTVTLPFREEILKGKPRQRHQRLKT